MLQSPHRPKRWSHEEYERLVEIGAFEGQPIELIAGELVVAEPHSPYHDSGISAADYAIRAALPAGWLVRIQAAVALDDDSEPEPDLVVVPGRPGDYRESQPTRLALVVEVAHSSVRFDRTRKGRLYARAGIEDYWIVNLVDRVLEVYRDPRPDATAPYGWRYASVTRWTPPDVVSPLAFPSSRIALADLLP